MLGAVETEDLLCVVLPGELKGFLSGADDRLRNLLDDLTVCFTVVLLVAWSLLLLDDVGAGGIAEAASFWSLDFRINFSYAEIEYLDINDTFISALLS